MSAPEKHPPADPHGQGAPPVGTGDEPAPDTPPPPRPTDLSGTWSAAEADEELRRRYQEASFDDSAWEAVEVPGSWRSRQAFSSSDGPLLLRRRFEAPPPGDGERAWLVLDGIFYTSDVWLDGTYVGDTEGYFFPHSFEVTDLVRERSDHLLAVEVACPPPGGVPRRAIAGVLQRWDAMDAVEAGGNLGGIRRTPRLERTGPVRISRLRVLCEGVDQEAATVAVRAVLDADEARTVELRTTLHSPGGRELLELSRDQHLAAGANRIEWDLAIPDPRLWWPWALGSQPLYRVAVEVLDDGSPSDSRERLVGMREVALRNWQLTVNGERFFPRGANLGSPRFDAPGGGAASARDVELAREGGLDLLRVNGYVARPELYEAADRAGLLLWQDLPLQWGYARSVRRQARRQAGEALDLLAHHPSVAIWGNMATLDRSMTRLLSRADGSRPVVTHSGVLPQPPVFDGTGGRSLPGWPGRGNRLRALLRTSALRPGERLDLDVQAVNHLDISFPDMILSVDLQWRREDGSLVSRENRSWQGQLPAGSCVLAASVDSVAPAAARSLRADLQLARPTGEVLATNTYAVPVQERRRRLRLPRRARG